jgi:glutamyl-tRNA synthetase
VEEAVSVRVRFAPSPTGYLHVGGARTALFNWLFARHHGGSFILRIEDTDRTRYVPDSLEDIMEGLKWLGLEWDEGPGVGGPYGPYFQSQRLELYQKYAHILVERGWAYKCFCSPERLERLREEQRRKKQPPSYDRYCRFLPDEEKKALEAEGRSYVIRLKVPLEGKTTFHDLIHGEITVNNVNIEDLILLKSDGYPTYHLANVVDDHFMKITHVMRADEWIPSTPKHILLYKGFGWEPPQFAHLPVILSPTGKGKMSKRKTVGPDGRIYPVLVREFKEAGYLPEAMFNFLALVGWSYDDRTEIMTKEQLIERFSLERVKSSPASFSYDKLEWMNGYYIRQLNPDDLANRLVPFLQRAGLQADFSKIRPIVPLIQERIKTLSDAVALVDFFFQEAISYEPEALVGDNMTPRESLEALRRAYERLVALPSFEEKAIEESLRALAAEMGLKAGQLFGIIRTAVTGKKVAPPLFGSMAILGKDRTLARMEKALKLLEKLAA